MALALSTSTPFFLAPSSWTSSLPTLPQTTMAGPFLHVSKIAPAPVISSLDALAQTCVSDGFSSTAGISYPVVPIPVDLGAAPFSGGGVALVGRSSPSLFPASFTLSHNCAVVTSTKLLSDSTSEAGASDTATPSRQLAVAKSQRDAARHEHASVWSESHQVRDMNEKLQSALNLLRGPFYETRSPLLSWVSRLDAIMSQLALSDDKNDGLT